MRYMKLGALGNCLLNIKPKNMFEDVVCYGDVSALSKHKLFWIKNYTVPPARKKVDVNQNWNSGHDSEILSPFL